MENISAHRINRLLNILRLKEDQFREQLDYLGVLSIKQMTTRSGLSQNLIHELNKYTLEGVRELRVNSEFVEMLRKKSNLYAFEEPIRDLRPLQLEKVC